MAKYPIQGADFVILGSTGIERKGILKLLKWLKSTPSSDMGSFTRESQLAEHFVSRVEATILKRWVLFCLLYAERKHQPSLYISGALFQDKTGDSQQTRINGKVFLRGTQAGHVAIGTYTVDGKPMTADSLQFLNGINSSQRKQCPGLRRLTADGLILDGGTEIVPAFVNQASGLIEVTCIYYMKGLLSVLIPETESDLEKRLETEAQRIIDFFLNKRVILIKPIEERLAAIKRGLASEFSQNPSDHANALFQGKESLFLQALLDQLTQPSSLFHQLLTQQVLNRVSEDAREYTLLAAMARQERT